MNANVERIEVNVHRPSRRAQTLDTFQQLALLKATEFQRILDLGGYDGDFSHWLLSRQAIAATVVDKEIPAQRFEHASLNFKRIYFSDFEKTMTDGEFDVALLSWPINNWSTSLSLIPILKRVPMVAYVGKNDGVNQCGTPHLWRYLVTRALTSVAEGQRNTVLVYSGPGRDLIRQPLVQEEYHGLHADDAPDDLDPHAEEQIRLLMR